MHEFGRHGQNRFQARFLEENAALNRGKAWIWTTSQSSDLLKYNVAKYALCDAKSHQNPEALLRRFLLQILGFCVLLCWPDFVFFCGCDFLISREFLHGFLICGLVHKFTNLLAIALILVLIWPNLPF